MIATYRRFALPALVVSSFGPVLGGGIRLEHVAAFGLALLGLVLGGRRVPSTLVLITVGWLALTCIAVSDTLRSISGHYLPMQSPINGGKDVAAIGGNTLLAGMAQLLLPVAAAIVALRSDDGSGRTLALRTLVILTALNTFVAILQFTVPDVALPLLKLFWPGGEEGTALLSMGNGRFGGIFNHPAEAAMATTVALFVLPVAWREGPSRDWAVGLLLPLLVIGGLLSFSKTVLFLGFPLAAIHFVMEHRRRTVFSPRASLLLGAWTAVGLVGLVTVMGRLGLTMESFANLVVMTTVGNGGVVGTATGGRFSADGAGTVAWAFGQVLSLSPLVGTGFGTFLAYDSMYLVAFAYAGAVGLLVYLGTLVALSSRVSKVARPHTLGLALLFVALAGLGIPTFTSMRVGVLLTVFVLLLVIQPKERSLGL